MQVGDIKAPHPTTAGLEYKATTAVEETGLIGADDQTGVVEAIVSVTGVLDHDKDVIEPGAYKDTLTKRRPKGIFSHDWGKWASRTEAVEELMPGDPRLAGYAAKMNKPWPAGAGGLYVRTRYNLDTQTGRDAYNDVKFFSETGECEWSIGYKVPTGKGVRGKDGVRRIREVDLYEYSPVLFGANSMSGTVSVKAADVAAAGDVDTAGLAEAVEALAELDDVTDVLAEDAEDTPSGEGDATDAKEDPEAAPDGEGEGGAAEDRGAGEPAGEGPDEAATGGDEAAADEEGEKGAPPFKKAPPKSGSGADAVSAGGDGETSVIKNVDDLKKAIQGFGGVADADKEKVRAHIMKRAFALHRPDLIPAAWKTSSSGKSILELAEALLGVPYEWPDTETKRKFSDQQRRSAADDGAAMPDGSYPIKTPEDLKNAIQAYGRAAPGDQAAVMAHIMKRARALGHPEMIPEAWTKAGKGTGAGVESKLAHEPLNRSPKKNWVEMVGQLPAYIQHIAKDMHEQKGMPLSVAIPTAIAAVKRWAAGGGDVNADTRAKAQAAVAEWEALKAKAAARRAANASTGKDYDAALEVGPDAGHLDPPVEMQAQPRLPGSHEELRDKLHTAAHKALAVDDPYLVEVLGTWPDKTVVTRYVLDSGRKAQSYEIRYTPDGDRVLLDDPVPVRVTYDAGGEPADVGDLLPQPAMLDGVVESVKTLLAVETKAGRVLSAANTARLKTAVENLVAVLTAAGIDIQTPDEPETPAEEAAEPPDSDSTAPSARAGTTYRAPAGKTLLDPALVAAGYRIVGDAHARHASV